MLERANYIGLPPLKSMKGLKMVQINYKEYMRVWAVNNTTINVSNEEAEQLKSGEIDLKSLLPEFDYEYRENTVYDILDDFEVEYELINMEVM